MSNQEVLNYFYKIEKLTFEKDGKYFKSVDLDILSGQRAEDDIAGITLVGTKPTVASGRIVVDPAAAQSLPRNIMIAAQSAEAGISGPPPPPARVADDYTFELRSFPGRMRLNLAGGAPGGGLLGNWAIRAVRLNGVDVTDRGIDFKPNDPITGLEVELTNRPTAGTIHATVRPITATCSATP